MGREGRRWQCVEVEERVCAARGGVDRSLSEAAAAVLRAESVVARRLKKEALARCSFEALRICACCERGLWQELCAPNRAPIAEIKGRHGRGTLHLGRGSPLLCNPQRCGRRAHSSPLARRSPPHHSLPTSNCGPGTSPTAVEVAAVAADRLAVVVEFAEGRAVKERAGSKGMAAMEGAMEAAMERAMVRAMVRRGWVVAAVAVAVVAAAAREERWRRRWRERKRRRQWPRKAATMT